MNELGRLLSSYDDEKEAARVSLERHLKEQGERALGALKKQLATKVHSPQLMLKATTTHMEARQPPVRF